MNPVKVWSGMDRSDKQMFTGIAATLVVWWAFAGKRKYSTRGMK